jgi:uncharacterized membrane protein YczE
MNVSFLLLSIHIMHRRIIKDEKSRWFIEDVGLPLLTTLVVVVAGRLLFPKENIHTVSTIFLLGVIYIISLGTSILVSPHARNQAREIFKRSLSKAITEN